MNEQVQPPTTVKEIGIHLFYMSTQMKELNEKVAGLSTKEHVEQLEARVSELEKKRIVRDTVLPISLVITVLISVLTLYQLLTGVK